MGNERRKTLRRVRYHESDVEVRQNNRKEESKKKKNRCSERETNDKWVSGVRN